MGAAFRNIRNRKNRERVRSSLRPFSAGLRSTQAKAGLLTRFRRDAFPTARSVARDCRDDSPEHPGRNSQQRELLQTCTAFPFNPCGRAAREPFAGAKVAFSAVFPNPKPKIRPFDPIPPTSGKAAARPRADFLAAARQGAARSPAPSGNDPLPRHRPATIRHPGVPTARPRRLFTIRRPLASRQRPSPRSTQFAAIRPSVTSFRTNPATSHLHIAAILCPATGAPSRNRSLPATGAPSSRDRGPRLPATGCSGHKKEGNAAAALPSFR